MPRWCSQIDPIVDDNMSSSLVSIVGLEALEDLMSAIQSSSRLVVPELLVLPDKAEQTMATRCDAENDGMISPQIRFDSFPRLVPPYFCTIQGFCAVSIFVLLFVLSSPLTEQTHHQQLDSWYIAIFQPP